MLTRRQALLSCANGFGGMALSALLAEGAVAGNERALDPMKVWPPHYPAKAKSVIFLFMDGGVSHVDSFDPKERLQKESGKPLPLQRPQFVRAVSPILFGSPFEFKRYGQNGTEISSMFPHVASCVDD